EFAEDAQRRPFLLPFALLPRIIEKIRFRRLLGWACGPRNFIKNFNARDGGRPEESSARVSLRAQAETCATSPLGDFPFEPPRLVLRPCLASGNNQGRTVCTVGVCAKPLCATVQRESAQAARISGYCNT